MAQGLLSSHGSLTASIPVVVEKRKCCIIPMSPTISGPRSLRRFYYMRLFKSLRCRPSISKTRGWWGEVRVSNQRGNRQHGMLPFRELPDVIPFSSRNRYSLAAVQAVQSNGPSLLRYCMLHTCSGVRFLMCYCSTVPVDGQHPDTKSIYY